MNGLKKISERIGKAILSRRSPRNRGRKGYNLKTAQRILILFADKDEELHRAMRAFCKDLKDNHGLKRAKAVAFINGTEKDAEIYHAHKLEMDYFTREDLSWKLKASQNLRTILNEPCDILIDAAKGDNLYLNYFVKFCSASMIVGRSGNPREDNYDLTIQMDRSRDTESFLKETESILAKLNIQ